MNEKVNTLFSYMFQIQYTMQWISESQNFTMSWDLKPAYVTKRLCIYEEGIKIQKQAVADCEREMQQISTSCGTVVENKGKALNASVLEMA